MTAQFNQGNTYLKKILLFTDLDGTLLEEATYSAHLSRPALKKLQAWDVSIIFCSSKTRAEQLLLQKELGIKDPFIAENGSAIVIPSGTFSRGEEDHEDALCNHQILVLGLKAEEIRNKLKNVKQQTGITYQSFNDLTNEEVAHLTGLDFESASRAKSREYSETIVTHFRPLTLEKFVQECAIVDLKCVAGGRYLTVTGQGADKGNAVRNLTELYKSKYSDIVTIGIGDSLNDAPMLKAVDIPYLVKRSNGQFVNVNIENLNYLDAIGPYGFVKMVDEIKKRVLKPE